VSNILELTEMATSYGVEIPNTDGRAGMVAIPVKDIREIDMDKLYKACVDQLPKYARPMFVRLIKEIQMTSKCLMLALLI
jgi:fatty-acyl-CoA synthase